MAVVKELHPLQELLRHPLPTLAAAIPAYASHLGSPSGFPRHDPPRATSGARKLTDKTGQCYWLRGTFSPGAAGVNGGMDDDHGIAHLDDPQTSGPTLHLYG